MMTITQTDDGRWRVEVSETAAVEFAELHEAEDFMDFIDSGAIPTKALEVVLRRRDRNEKQNGGLQVT